jgi:cytochrome c oxidase assembly protein subunit 15
METMEQSLGSYARRSHGAKDAAVRSQIAAWLLACCALVFAMVVVGGVTRLTHSGLSITEWQPILGAIPPLSDAAWQEAFAKYQLTPEYLHVNSHMTVEEFKPIFWMEWAHRLLGRLIGLVFFFPFFFFLLLGKLDRSLGWKLAGIFALGGLQGAMGWYMVQSGLVDDPRVSQYRLTAHLGLAFLIYGLMFWVALGLLQPRADRLHPRLAGLRRHVAWLIAFICLMVLTGGFVAGIRAGFAYNTFPLMNGHLVPPELFMLEPWWANFSSNMATVQFNHRLFAWVLAFLVPWFWLRSRRHELPACTRAACNALIAALALQLALGIATLLLVVPLTLAAAHQAGALLLLSAALWVAHELHRDHVVGTAGAQGALMRGNVASADGSRA